MQSEIRPRSPGKGIQAIFVPPCLGQHQGTNIAWIPWQRGSRQLLYLHVWAKNKGQELPGSPGKGRGWGFPPELLEGTPPPPPSREATRGAPATAMDLGGIGVDHGLDPGAVWVIGVRQDMVGVDLEGAQTCYHMVGGPWTACRTWVVATSLSPQPHVRRSTCMATQAQPEPGPKRRNQERVGTPRS